MGRLRHPLACHWQGQRVSIDWRIAETHEFKDGKVVPSLFGFPDVAAALEALGVSEQATGEAAALARFGLAKASCPPGRLRPGGVHDLRCGRQAREDADSTRPLRGED